MKDLQKSIIKDKQKSYPNSKKLKQVDEYKGFKIYYEKIPVKSFNAQYYLANRDGFTYRARLVDKEGNVSNGYDGKTKNDSFKSIKGMINYQLRKKNFKYGRAFPY